MHLPPKLLAKQTNTRTGPRDIIADYLAHFIRHCCDTARTDSHGIRVIEHGYGLLDDVGNARTTVKVVGLESIAFNRGALGLEWLLLVFRVRVVAS